MTAAAAWWRGLSATDRYRFYTRLSFQAAVAVPVIVAATDTGRWGTAGVALAAVASLAVVETHPDFSLRARSGPRRVVLPFALLVLVALAAAFAVASHAGSASLDADQTRTVGALLSFLVALCVLPFLPRSWLLLALVSVVLGAAYASSVASAVWFALALGVVGAIAMVITFLTWWGLRVIDDLEHARAVEAQLQVAEERLRFSRDLHDVVGRGFSAVAVKSELAATLVRAGHAERAAAEIDEVKALAVESMDQVRGLVRGYRDISLASEVAGARSLLSAAGCRLDVEGEVERVPERYHEVAAWVVREGVTNVVKHSTATWARLTLGPSGMSLRNDAALPVGGPSADDPAPSGHRGLVERLAAVGATLTTSTSDDEFLLEVRWEAAP